MDNNVNKMNDNVCQPKIQCHSLCDNVCQPKIQCHSLCDNVFNHHICHA